MKENTINLGTALLGKINKAENELTALKYWEENLLSSRLDAPSINPLTSTKGNGVNVYTQVTVDRKEFIYLIGLTAVRKQKEIEELKKELENLKD